MLVEPKANRGTPFLHGLFAGQKLAPLAYAGSVAIVAAALLIGLSLQWLGAGPANAGLVFLVAVLMCSATYGLWPGLFACVVSALAYNFFFFPPIYTLTIADPRNAVTMIIFAVVALIANNLAVRIRAQTLAAEQRAAMMENLYLFSRKLAGAFSLDDLLWAIAYQFAKMLDAHAVILLPEGAELVVRAGYPPEDALGAAEMAAARRVWESATRSAQDPEPTTQDRRNFLPMRTGRGVVGIVGLEGRSAQTGLSREQLRLFHALADQAALAIERITLSEDIDKARLAAETERLRASLLTSVSHDLRTPLASILGSASSLKNHRFALDIRAQDELIGTIHEEAERLNRFIANLLDMTRLESGAIEPRFEYIDVADVAGSALRRARNVLSGHRVELAFDPDLPMVKIDPVLFEQVLFNLLDNAAKYAPAGTAVRLKAERCDARLRIALSDEGAGIPDSDLERVFDKFYRARAADRKRAGTGLGLPICRGFLEAMGGTIIARNAGPKGGAVFTIEFPIPADQPRERAA